MKQHNTSWNKVGKWYNKLVGNDGHYYHQHVVIPKSLTILNLKPGDHLLDVGCGQGVMARQLPKGVLYTGIDTSSELIQAAKKTDSDLNHTYITADATKPFPFTTQFTHSVVMLALQNMDSGEQVISTISKHLIPHGRLLIVLNHPAFRIPRQSSWGIDETNKLQYRKINRYLSPLKIPINMNPGEKTGEMTWSFHHPLSDYFAWLKKANFVVEDLQEWASDKESVGKASKMENLSRAEIPLFMAIVASKI